MVSEWFTMADDLMLRFSDNYCDNEVTGQKRQDLGYPLWWLQTVGFQNGPPVIPN
jgi:hypothetical protein